VAPERSDPELLRAHAVGEAAAFAQLYDRHERACFIFMRRLLGAADEATAEDLHQEVWLAVARAALTFDPSKARFVTWLFTIARNKVMDHFRRVGADPVVAHAAQVLDGDDAGDGAGAGPGGSEVEMPDVADPHAITPDAVLQNRQLAAALLREVQALPFVQRETFVLFAQHEMSLEDVAHITQVGIETAKSRLRYARTALRSNLAGWKLHHA
jgi:RNA polymerase sigma factor (sigma-70 family)